MYVCNLKRVKCFVFIVLTLYRISSHMGLEVLKTS